MNSGKERKMENLKANLFFVPTLLSFAMCAAGLAFSGTGSGTESDPYVITTVEQLQQMNDNLNACYALGNDIDASATATWNGGAGLVPIGTQSNPFTGILDGRRHTVMGLYINRPLEDFVALFGYIGSGAELTNVGVIAANVTGYSDVGALVGYGYGCTITNCFSTGAVTGKESGGINSRVGGLLGRSSGYSSVAKCYSAADVTSGAWQVGDLSGYNGHGSVIIDCYATGNVSGQHKAGGLVGDNLYPEGGFVKRCYSTGKVTGGGGGLIGYNFQGGVTYDSYWDTETSGRTSSKGGTGKTTAQMMRQATFVNWDFVDVWGIAESQSYPFLRVFSAVVVELGVDIKPGSCPNPLNPASKGLLPVAILGSEQFDVNTIDVASIRLEGIAPVWSTFEDVASPVTDGNDCNCNAAGPDGYTDMALKFKTQDIVEELVNLLREITSGDELMLTLTGALLDGTLIEGEDCIVIVGKVPKALAAKKSDINGDGVVDIVDFAEMSQYWLQFAAR